MTVLMCCRNNRVVTGGGGTAGWVEHEPHLVFS